MPKTAPKPGRTSPKVGAPICALCRGGELGTIHDRIRSGSETAPCPVLRCRNCGLVFLDQAALGKSLQDFYMSGDYRKAFSPSTAGAVSSVEEYFREFHLPAQKKRLRRLEHLFDKTSRVLEIGCGSGGFLYALKDKVASVIGVELDAKHAAYGQSLGLDIHNAPLEELRFGAQFDFICLFHVFEHLPDPLTFAKSLRALLKPGGRLILEVPGVDDPLISIFGVREFKSFYYQVPHLYYFSEKTLSRLLRKAGFAEPKYLSYQQYALLNNLSWALNGAPFNKTRDEAERSIPPAAHLADPDPREMAELMDYLDAAYRQYLRKKGRLDTLVCVAERGA